MSIYGVVFKKEIVLNRNTFMGGASRAIVGENATVIQNELSSYDSAQAFIESHDKTFRKWDYVNDDIVFNTKKVNSYDDLITRIHSVANE
jgi:hypothetical protein